jgi:hypothetical protein
MAFLSLDCEEALLGGAAGGAKSSSLLMAALMYAHVPGYNALILRRSYADLAKPGAIMDRSHQWLAGTGARWNSTHKTWTFPSGARLVFGYLQNARDHLQYQSTEFCFVAFDELSQFESYQYRYLFSRLRRLQGVEIPLRMRAASNPGGPGSLWVRKRFVERKRAGRVFIPAKFTDNPYLDWEQYRKALSHLDSVTRAQLLDGDWFVSSAGLIYPGFQEATAVSASEIPWERLKKCDGYGGVDWGWNHPFAAVHGVLDDDDVLWITWCRYKRFCTVAQHAAKLPRDGTDEGASQTLWFADPSRPENIRDLPVADFVVRPAPNRIEPGIDMVRERYRTGRLKILDTLTPIFAEAGIYSDGSTASEDDDDDDDVGLTSGSNAPLSSLVDADPDTFDVVGTSAPEEPTGDNDDICDALRYCVAGIAQVAGVSWADQMNDAHMRDPDEEEEEGNYGRRGFQGEEDIEDYTKACMPPKRIPITTEPVPSPAAKRRSLLDERWWEPTN